ncbi:unnamed protein product [Effrenium voratum]|nr:unnamed protein product [Effrenium voratum]
MKRAITSAKRVETPTRLAKKDAVSPRQQKQRGYEASRKPRSRVTILAERLQQLEKESAERRELTDANIQLRDVNQKLRDENLRLRSMAGELAAGLRWLEDYVSAATGP